VPRYSIVLQRGPNPTAKFDSGYPGFPTVYPCYFAHPAFRSIFESQVRVSFGNNLVAGHGCHWLSTVEDRAQQDIRQAKQQQQKHTTSPTWGRMTTLARGGEIQKLLIITTPDLNRILPESPTIGICERYYKCHGELLPELITMCLGLKSEC
jgi:hypothetical protein